MDDGRTQGTIITSASEATHATGQALGHLLGPGDVLLLTGDLGAGKTQLAKGIAAGLQVEGPITSPTFGIIRVHEGASTLYHVDLYRLERADELEDTGYFEVLEAGGVAVVEWGDRFPEAIPPEHLAIRIEIVDEAKRALAFQAHGARYARLASSWLAACDALAGVEVRR
ncbi:MAG: tRNA (adenosine(37)-N6)-threonylcarbamoyltransferase complex ATPase subunit type 1 TsaE [Actinobacteria bacterium]|nr:tRNA (adenosine(37)-N6)-threonylcarbamoyltransferase complex ATPase subunit type 1 TsaE [Actinomycetota bacterium]